MQQPNELVDFVVTAEVCDATKDELKTTAGNQKNTDRKGVMATETNIETTGLRSGHYN